MAAAGGLFVLLMLLYWPVTDFRMLAFDDAHYAASPDVSGGVVGETVLRIFTTLPEEDLLIPVTQLSFMADVDLYGGVHARGFHLTNLLVFALSMALLLLFLWRATGAFGRSALAASLVALHPLRVESVAWVTERKDVLAVLFLVLAMACHLRLARTGKARWHGPLLLCTVLSLLSKPLAVTLPVLLLLLDWWPLGRFHPPPGEEGGGGRRALRLLAEKTSLLILSGLVSWVTMHINADEGIHWELSLLSRVNHSLASPLVYLYQTFWPADLAFRYFESLWTPFEGTLLPVSLALAAITAVAFRSAPSRPYLLFGWAWFVAAPFPSSGIIPAGIYWVADRFTFVPHFGLAVAFAWGTAGLLPPRDAKGRGRGGRDALRLLPALALLSLLAFLTRGQLYAWKDGATFYGKGLPQNRGVVRYEAHYVDELVELGEFAKARGAIAHLLPLALDPWRGTPVQLSHLVLVEREEGLGASVSLARRYLDRDPNFWRTRLYLADALRGLGRHEEAVPEYRKVLETRAYLSPPHRHHALSGLEESLAGLGEGGGRGERQGGERGAGGATGSAPQGPGP